MGLIQNLITNTEIFGVVREVRRVYLACRHCGRIELPAEVTETYGYSYQTATFNKLRDMLRTSNKNEVPVMFIPMIQHHCDESLSHTSDDEPIRRSLPPISVFSKKPKNENAETSSTARTKKQLNLADRTQTLIDLTEDKIAPPSEDPPVNFFRKEEIVLGEK